MNRDVDEAQYIANRRRGSVKVDVTPIGMSYDQMHHKVKGRGVTYNHDYDHG